ncbi:MAG: CCA tRNA nucleotidyltransferase [Caldibacillus debilis]|jgi:tRNA nucleotidyltransferase (CCA-adding enzyme)|uniref:CCA tRNA nucleotidyltransferase n=1 Tax=Caldibacillus debilis TaxID=301148 RepID=UPI000E36899A|nr:CCA tRNA nucleotidyltransferase [Caldibacillus debilis]REJ16517.1 MAG: CCA tRNA nucleotidyltransferase [Caldibacillus debilis]
MKPPFKKAARVIEKIEQAGFEAYFVGGSVRDLLLGKEINDVDIATSATPEEVKRIFPHTVDVGIEHGTVLVLEGGESYEITTFRTEGEYVDFRRPKEVSFVRSLTEDLKRRDFTINAIAMTKEGEFVDPFGGKEDLEKGILRTVGKPEERFSEDALRMLRAARFVSQLGFAVEENTYRALKESAPLLKHIAVERKLAEFTKIMTGDHVKKACEVLVSRDLYRYLPNMEAFPGQLLKAAEILRPGALDETEVWALLFLVIRKENCPRFLKEWRLPTKKIKEIYRIYDAFHDRLSKEWDLYGVYTYGLETSLSAEKIHSLWNGEELDKQLARVRELYEKLPIKSRKELQVNGNDLLLWKNKGGGKWVEEDLRRIEKAVISGEVENDKRSIKEWLMP